MSIETMILTVTKRRRLSLNQGFSLIEVTMALGIVAFAFTSLLGLLPLGLNIFRDAMETSVTSRIFQRIGGDLQQSDFDTLSAASQQVRYFDEQGNELSSTKGSIYWAKAQVFSGADLPGTSNNTDLSRVLIQIARNPSGITVPEDAQGLWTKNASISLSRRALFVARNTAKSGS